jgi:pheromone shutdown protein TraB
MTRVTMVAITHIDHESQDRVKKVLGKIKPDAVCLEIDEIRLRMLLEHQENGEEEIKKNKEMTMNERIDNHEKEKIPTIERKRGNNESESFLNSENNDNFLEKTFVENKYNPLLADIGFFEREIAATTKTFLPAKEMVIAYHLAEKLGSDIHLIDRSINEISRLMEEQLPISESESFREMMMDLITELLSPGNSTVVGSNTKQENEEQSNETKNEELPGEMDKTKNNLELEVNNSSDMNLLNELMTIFTAEENIQEILDQFEEEFPQLFDILLKGRNAYMIDKLLEIIDNYKEIVVILGYGHVFDIAESLKEKREDIIVEIKK